MDDGGGDGGDGGRGDGGDGSCAWVPRQLATNCLRAYELAENPSEVDWTSLASAPSKRFGVP